MESQCSTLTLADISPLFTTEILQKCVQTLFMVKKIVATVPVITTVFISYASGKGDGYCGIIYRINVSFENGLIIHLIGKGMPPNLARRKAFQSDVFFEKEIHFYNRVVATMRDFEKQQLGEKCESFLAFPHCYYAHSDGENDFLVLEDLKDDGYAMQEKSIGFNKNQLSSIIRIFAQFQGVSYAIKFLDPDLFHSISDLSEMIFHPKRADWFEKYLLGLSEIFLAAVQDELEDTEVLEKFRRFIRPDELYKRMCRTVQRGENAVISHGDAWVANFMFREDSKVKVIDFQLVRCASPILDISTLLFSCSDKEARSQLGDCPGILAFYHQHLLTTIMALGAPADAVPTLEAVHQEWRCVGDHGLGCALELALLALSEDKEQSPASSDNPDEVMSLAQITCVTKITKPESRRRLVDLVLMAAHEGLI